MNILILFKTQLLYTFFEFKSRLIGNILTLLIYTGLIILFIYQRASFIERSNYDNIIITNVIYYIILIRMMIGGMFSPYNIIEKEVNKYKLYHKHTLMKYGCESLLFLHICSKIVSSFFINVITTLGLLFSLGLIYDIRNYITLFVVLLFGMFYISVIGYFIAVIGIALNLKRELVSFIHIIIVVFFTQIKNVSFLFPFSVVRSELNGIINSDLVFSQVYNIELSKIGYFIISLIISLILSYVFLLTLGITSRYKKIKGEHYKHAINFE